MTTAISDASRAESVWRHIQRKASSVVFTKPKVVGVADPEVLPAQMVRVVRDNRPSMVRGEAGNAPRVQAVVFGVRDHPDAAIADTDMARGYTFRLDGSEYVCDYVNLVPGGKQGIFLLQG